MNLVIRLRARLCGAMIVLFLFAQGAVLAHQFGIEKHSLNHHCEICLLDAELHGANLQAAVAVIVVPTAVRPVIQDYGSMVEPASRVYSARAPPTV